MPNEGTKFNNDMYVTAYELAREGLADKQIAQTLGVSGLTFKRWRGRDKYLQKAVDRGRRYREPNDDFTFSDYVYDQLSPDLRQLWDDINRCENMDNGVELVEAMLGNHGKRVRQHLFLYALTRSAFNVSQSLRKLNIPRKHFRNWCYHDPEFAELIQEVNWHKENFIESAFLGRVASGDTAAIIHAVKTKLRHRGYNEKIEIEHTGTVQHTHTVSLEALDLPVNVRRAVLAALRARSGGGTPQALPQAEVLA